jgi:uncharacterized protein (UPF0332 family)
MRIDAEYINSRLAKSGQAIREAELLFGAGFYSTAVSRLYYSVFYICTALLLKKGIITKTHKGVRTQFFQHFIHPGLIQKETGDFISFLFNLRQESDYNDAESLGKEEVENLIKTNKNIY